MNMRIEELHLKNFRCFKELDIKFPESNLAVFIGLNGAGKSAILDAIILTISHYWTDYTITSFSDNDINADYEEIISCAKIILTPHSFVKTTCSKKRKEILHKENDFTNVKSNLYDNKSFIIQYKANRDKVFFPKYFETSKNSEKFNAFKEWFIKEDYRELRLKKRGSDNQTLNIIRNTITVFFKHISDIPNDSISLSVEDTNDDNVDLMVSWGNKMLWISQLSDGQKNLLLLVSDIAFSLIDIALDELKKSQFSVLKQEEVLNRKGIVLIDEIELHLHPQWQRDVLPALQKTFPNIQFIVTTHSPQVLSNLKKEEIFILKDNKVSEFKPYIEGRDSNSILSEVFGVSERPKIFQDKLNEFYKAIDNKNLEEAKKLLKNLEEYWGTSDTEILKADLNLSFAEE